MKKVSNALRMSAVAFTAGLLVACGGSKEEAAETATEAVTTVEEVVEGAGDVAEDIEAMTGDADGSDEGAAEVSSSAAQALVDKCVAEGENEEVCNCQIGAIETALGEEDFTKLINLAKTGDDEAAQTLMTDIMTEKPEAAMKMGMEMQGCSAG